ncbi:MAG: aminotransferase class V-fold PLP-dependent enzyme [Staphylothermus sp.]|nr:aminotransferase class V-fold PLP-dependent enzyme [Staphylothermus sp.]
MSGESFPIFRCCKNGKPIIYSDNTATSQKPYQVIEAVMKYYSSYNANIHRGIRYLSMMASEMYKEDHETVSRFVNAETDEVTLVKNTSDAINIAVYSLAPCNLGRGNEIVLTFMIHYSDLLPWYKLTELEGVNIHAINVNDNSYSKIKELDNTMDEKTKLISITHVNNVAGPIYVEQPHISTENLFTLHYECIIRYRMNIVLEYDWKHQ